MNDFPYPVTARTKIANAIRKFFRHEPIERILILLFKQSHLVKKLIPPEYLYPTNSYRVVVRDGVTYRLDLSDVVSHSLYFFNRYFAPQQIIDMIKPGWNVIDVGAHIGTVALRAALQTKIGKVYAFEPDQKNFDTLEHNIRLNQFDNIFPIKKAVGAVSNTIRLGKVNQYNSGMNRITNLETGVESELVQAVTLDEEVLRLQIQKVELIKIDVEGYELNVLIGAKATLEKFRPKMIIELIETNLRGYGHSAKEVIQFLEGLGYHCIDLKTQKPVTNFENIETDIYCWP